jgi:hypothetical protein
LTADGFTFRLLAPHSILQPVFWGLQLLLGGGPHPSTVLQEPQLVFGFGLGFGLGLGLLAATAAFSRPPIRGFVIVTRPFPIQADVLNRELGRGV